MKHTIPDTEKIEVVVAKQITFGEYKKMYPGLVKKGWNVKAFQLGLHSFGTQKEIQ